MLKTTGSLLITLLLFAGLLPATIHAAPPAQDTETGECGDPATPIHVIQGVGMESPLTGNTVAVEGVVTADYQERNQLQGFFMQEEAAHADADLATSEGIFVYKSGQEVEVGDVVRVTGKVVELKASGVSLTELSNIKSRLIVCGEGEAIAPVEIVLPVDDLEAVEGMVVTFPQELTVNELYNLGRYGEILLSADGRLFQPTNLVRPGARAQELADENARRSILLDDGSPEQNSDPTLYPAGGLSAENTIRTGDTVTGITGVLDQRHGVYRIQPLEVGEFASTNPRTDAPDEVHGRLRVASFNVLNYFNGNGAGGGFPTPRGANTTREFERQEAKIVNAILALDADIVG